MLPVTFLYVGVNEVCFTDAQYSALCIVLSHFKLSETLDASNTFFFLLFLKGHLPLSFVSWMLPEGESF